ncbi:universal stress protein [bacterium]|nr:MAG: universal stress protein [bacterium]
MKDRTPRRILVAVDFSPASRRALRYASDLAMQSGASLDLIHVVTPIFPMAAGPEPISAQPLLIDERRQLEAELNAWCDAARDQGIDSETVFRDGDAAANILACAEERGADHIVLGAHGHSAFHDFLLGSVAREVQRRATCPVTTLREREPEPAR